METRCQVWHWCLHSGQIFSFLCPNGTVFNQVSRPRFLLKLRINPNSSPLTELPSLRLVLQRRLHDCRRGIFKQRGTLQRRSGESNLTNDSQAFELVICANFLISKNLFSAPPPPSFTINSSILYVNYVRLKKLIEKVE